MNRFDRFEALAMHKEKQGELIALLETAEEVYQRETEIGKKYLGNTIERIKGHLKDITEKINLIEGAMKDER